MWFQWQGASSRHCCHHLKVWAESRELLWSEQLEAYVKTMQIAKQQWPAAMVVRRLTVVSSWPVEKTLLFLSYCMTDLRDAADLEGPSEKK